MHPEAKERLEKLKAQIETREQPPHWQYAALDLGMWIHELAEIVQLLCEPDGMPSINNGEQP